MSENLLTWSQAAKIFADAGLSEATLNRRIKDGILEPVSGHRKSAKYPEQEVRNAIDPKVKQEKPVGVTDWVQLDDLQHLLKLDYQLYGEYLAVPATITQHWWKKNPTACRILFNEHDRTDIWGAISIIPMREETAIALVSERMEEKDITEDDVLTYEDGSKHVAYVPSAAIHPKHKASLSKLLNSVIDFWCEQYPRVQLVKLYAYASSDEGMELMKYLFFSPRYDLGENVFELDPYRRNPSPFVKRFQRGIADKAA